MSNTTLNGGYQFEYHYRDNFWTRRLPGDTTISCTGNDDFSAEHTTYPCGYDERCACCWLHHNHTEAVHQMNILKYELKKVGMK